MKYGFISLLIISLAVTSCNRADQPAQLPPARGEGAPPMPKLPQIRADVQDGTSVAPTEGQTTGTTYARQEAQIAPNAGGIIVDIAVEEGAHVKKGQVIFRLDPRDADLRVQQAKAALAAAEVNLRASKTEYDRSKSLLEQNAVNRAQWEQVEARYDAARITVDQAKVGMQMAEKALADTIVHAPFDGVVTAKLKSEGEMATMMPPTIVLTLQQQSTLELKFRLPERALATLKAGVPVTARFDSLGVTRTAKIARIQPAVDARTRTVEVVAELPNTDHLLRPGLLAEVKLGEGESNAP